MLVIYRNLASPCEGEGDRLRWRGRKTCGNVCKIDLSVILLRKMPAPLIEGEPSASFNSSLQIPICRTALKKLNSPFFAIHSYFFLSIKKRLWDLVKSETPLSFCRFLARRSKFRIAIVSEISRFARCEIIYYVNCEI